MRKGCRGSPPSLPNEYVSVSCPGPERRKLGSVVRVPTRDPGEQSPVACSCADVLCELRRLTVPSLPLKNENSTVLKLVVTLINKHKAASYTDCMRSRGARTDIQSFLFFSCLAELLTAEYIWNIQIHFLFQIIQLSQSNVSFPTFLTGTSPEFAGKGQLNMDWML